MRSRAAFALACYVAGAVATPALHRLHHARWGEDHTHAPGAAHQHHATFDADARALDLGDVAAAGTLAVDCALAAYTLVGCDGADADILLIGHARNFGDELLARAAHRRTPPPPDPSHGRFADQHVAPALLTAAPIVLPAPRVAGDRARADHTRAPAPARALHRHGARAPPRSAVA